MIFCEKKLLKMIKELPDRRILQFKAIIYFIIYYNYLFKLRTINYSYIRCIYALLNCCYRMAASGVGRGRGWLNLNKNSSNLPRPGDTTLNITANRITPAVPVSNNHAKISQTNITKYSPLLSQINTLSDNDDGILLNQKLKKF